MRNLEKQAELARQIKHQVDVLDVLLESAKGLDMEVTLFASGAGREIQRAEQFKLMAAIRAIM